MCGKLEGIVDKKQGLGDTDLMVETDSSSVAKRTRNRINCNGRSLHPVGTWVEHQKGLVGEKKNSVMIPEYVEKLELVRMEVHSKVGFGHCRGRHWSQGKGAKVH